MGLSLSSSEKELGWIRFATTQARLSTSGGHMEPSAALDQFWHWFRDNGERLQATIFGEDEEARDEAIAELRDASEEVAPGLVLEIGQPSSPGEPHALVIS